MRKKILSNEIGKKYSVLWESKDKNNDWTGYTENYNKVILNNSKKDLGNKISKIKIIGISSDFNHCIAELV
mgnify:FL=1